MQQRSAVSAAIAHVADAVAQELASQESQPQRLRNEGYVPRRGSRPRKRRSVADVYQELGDIYFRRAYRMKYNTFKRLASMLCPYIIVASGKSEERSSQNYRYIPNGAIATDVRLACALRWCVCRWLNLRHHDNIQYRTYRNNQQLLVCCGCYQQASCCIYIAVSFRS